jgi:6-pyruvoyltetrahydropterin/6-carboxytetrahydropterin synthase
MTGTIEIVKEFTFEAAHHFTHMPKGHGYQRLHGHSYHVEVALEGTPDAETGWIVEFSELAKAFDIIKDQADHDLLNNIEGLENPSLENLSQWIARELGRSFDALSWVRIRRPSCGEACTYRL